MTADVKLLPCPFCRHEACMDGTPGSWGYYPATAFVRCGECNARTPTFHDDVDGSRNYRSEAAAAWNRRTPDAKDAVIVDLQSTIEALRTEVERLTSLTAVTMGVGRGDGSLFVHGDYESIKAAQALVFRAERLAEALRIAIRQNSHDMLMTGDELRQCEAALHPTAAQTREAVSTPMNC